MRAGRHEEAAAAFAAALRLYRGPVLTDLQDGEIVGRFATWAAELRLECTEMLVECDLVLGRHRELVGLLGDLVSEHPLHEPFHRQLMVALHRGGRRADGLAAYRTARGVLSRELGLEPGRAMRELHQALLSGDAEQLVG
jgi:DNA-binding SARP family transcriptional activator